MWRLLRPDAVAVLDDKMARKSLSKYFAAMQNESPAKFMMAKRLPAQFSHDDTLKRLWQEHERLVQEFNRMEKEIDSGQIDWQKAETPKESYLDLKIEIARKILAGCSLCTRKCGVNRFSDERGYCKCGQEVAVSSIFEHVGEEPELAPSGTIFTMGCTMKCKHCQNWTISQWAEKGEVYSPKRMAKEVENLRRSGCRNINLVGGEPTPWLAQWFETFKHVEVNVPVVWNSNSYYSQETARLLAGFADVYLLDFKYGPRDCADRISDAPRYWDACTSNHLEAKRHGELIVRILVLPGHLECCTKPIANWIAENLGSETRVNLMLQYRPEWKAHEVPELCRRLTQDEMNTALQLAKEAKLTNFIT